MGHLYLTSKEAAQYTSLSESYLAKLRMYGKGPRFLRVGARSIRYSRNDLDLWMTRT
ncbi:helix-turn-helix domain-containing protein [Octadecabacter antarcticus]|uniref:helix-turn-helix domain-containing protein n=1 Tax=Octadecabacter antarcticus TaxID=1217908 RepID=UPI0011817ACB